MDYPRPRFWALTTWNYFQLPKWVMLSLTHFLFYFFFPYSFTCCLLKIRFSQNIFQPKYEAYFLLFHLTCLYLFFKSQLSVIRFPWKSFSGRPQVPQDSACFSCTCTEPSIWSYFPTLISLCLVCISLQAEGSCPSVNTTLKGKTFT